MNIPLIWYYIGGYSWVPFSRLTSHVETRLVSLMQTIKGATHRDKLLAPTRIAEGGSPRCPKRKSCTTLDGWNPIKGIDPMVQ